ncbi:ACT domain-containing protein [Microvirga sp. ACRRW]|uniref:ACT domain-containing protein n=1 Tax=Microvirga sp. ACRRW TaxID=2918205 RepID=UPI001EF61AE1|nr:ACT domain-containing protein [Microvirga sp. ACRRW]MCG7391413.1 ACT domain-containing protein [Microvirga sp. ACRRW]
MPALTLQLLERPYAVCRLPPGADVPSPIPGPFSLLIQSVEETTIVCPRDQAPQGAEIDSGWRCFRILQVFDFSVPGILASVLSPLALAGVGIFASSTFSTDYVLVKASDLDRAIQALAEAGHQITP